MWNFSGSKWYKNFSKMFSNCTCFFCKSTHAQIWVFTLFIRNLSMLNNCFCKNIKIQTWMSVKINDKETWLWNLSPCLLLEKNKVFTNCRHDCPSICFDKNWFCKCTSTQMWMLVKLNYWRNALAARIRNQWYRKFTEFLKGVSVPVIRTLKYSVISVWCCTSGTPLFI